MKKVTSLAICLLLCACMLAGCTDAKKKYVGVWVDPGESSLTEVHLASNGTSKMYIVASSNHHVKFFLGKGSWTTSGNKIKVNWEKESESAMSEGLFDLYERKWTCEYTTINNNYSALQCEHGEHKLPWINENEALSK